MSALPGTSVGIITGFKTQYVGLEKRIFEHMEEYVPPDIAPDGCKRAIVGIWCYAVDSTYAIAHVITAWISATRPDKLRHYRHKKACNCRPFLFMGSKDQNGISSSNSPAAAGCGADFAGAESCEKSALPPPLPPPRPPSICISLATISVV